MAIAIVQSFHNEKATSLSTISVTCTGITAGNALVALVTCADNVPKANISIADNSSTPFILDFMRDATNEGQWCIAGHLLNSPGGSRTITATFTGSSASNEGIQIFEISGMSTIEPVTTGTAVGNDSGAGTSTSFDSTISITPTVDGALIIAYAEGNGNQPVAAGAFTPGISDTVNIFTSETLIQTKAAAISPSYTLGVADRWDVIIIAYAPATVPILLNGSGDPRLLVNGN